MRHRLTISSLMAVVVIPAVGLAAMRSGSELWLRVAYTLTASVQGAYVFLGVSGGVSAQTWTSTTSYQTLKIQAIAGPGWQCSVGATVCPTVTTHVTYGANALGPRVYLKSINNTELKKIDADSVFVHQVTTR